MFLLVLLFGKSFVSFTFRSCSFYPRISSNTHRCCPVLSCSLLLSRASLPCTRRLLHFLSFSSQALHRWFAGAVRACMTKKMGGFPTTLVAALGGDARWAVPPTGCDSAEVSDSTTVLLVPASLHHSVLACSVRFAPVCQATAKGGCQARVQTCPGRVESARNVWRHEKNVGEI